MYKEVETKLLPSKAEARRELGFDDKADVSNWAETCVNKAVSAGLINGMGDNKFIPKDSAKREQAMVLIYRLINNKE